MHFALGTPALLIPDPAHLEPPQDFRKFMRKSNLFSIGFRTVSVQY